MARGQTGGKRQGTPGKSYSNRTDLSTNYAPSTPTQTPASGGVPVPSGGGGQAAPPEQPQSWTSPDAVPALDDPTARPGEPVTHGLGIGPGGGPEVLGLGTAAEGLRRLNQQNREYFGYLSGRTDLPDRVAAFVRQVRNS